MTDSLDAVPIRVNDERAIVVGVVLRPDARLAIVFCASLERSLVPLVDLGARVARKRDVRRRNVLVAVRDPEVGRGVAVPRDILA